MKQELIYNNEIKFVLTRDECGYEEVIDTFSEARYVRVVTFNISKEGKRLISELEALGKNCDLKIVSNIPGRYANYVHPNPRRNASRTIDKYLERLNPNSFSANTSTFFNFSNHSKIILTNKLAYIGSANFSDESANSIEAGIITSDTFLIQKIKDEFVESIIQSSEPYFDKTYLGAFIKLSKTLSVLEVLNEDLRIGFYNYTGHRNYEIEIYNYNNAYFDSEIYSSIVELIKKLDVDLDSYREENLFAEMVDLYDVALAFDIENHLGNSRKLSKLATFDHSWTANSILESEYGSYAYDEGLNHYMEIASQKASEIQESLATSAKDDADELFELLQKLFSNIKDMIIKLQVYKLVNEEIDNT